MNKYAKHIITAAVCLLLVLVFNFILPRLLPGDPVAYLTGLDEQGMSAEKYAYYTHALHLDENIFVQFWYYLVSIFNGTLGYSYKQAQTVSALVWEKIGNSLQITLPACVISIAVGVVWGLACGYKKGGALDGFSTTFFIVCNAVPTFVIALAAVAVLCFKYRIFPYLGLSSAGVEQGTAAYFWDRIYHLILPVTVLVLAALPARYLLVRNCTAQFCRDKSVAYAKERGLSNRKIKFSYVLKNIAQPVIAMSGAAVGACIGGSVVVENVFSVNGVGGLLLTAVHTLDYPLMQGILFITTFSMAIFVILSDILCILIDPKARKRK